jgi:hypothetical protein
VADSHIAQLWPTAVLSARFAEYQSVNPALVELFYEHRRRHPKAGRVYASRDDLAEVYKDYVPLQALYRFIMDRVWEIAAAVNRPYWKSSPDYSVGLTGLWFQITNDHGFHETHVHGNCSWSGVYYVQVGGCSRSATDRPGGLGNNGITRFYGPPLDITAGGHGEFGNLYLQDGTWDSYPEDGGIVVFPSHLKHMAFPYQGENDRIIVSFHAQVHGPKELRYSDAYSFD